MKRLMHKNFTNDKEYIQELESTVERLTDTVEHYKSELKYTRETLREVEAQNERLFRQCEGLLDDNERILDSYDFDHDDDVSHTRPSKPYIRFGATKKGFHIGFDF